MTSESGDGLRGLPSLSERVVVFKKITKKVRIKASSQKTTGAAAGTRLTRVRTVVACCNFSYSFFDTYQRRLVAALFLRSFEFAGTETLEAVVTSLAIIKLPFLSVFFLPGGKERVVRRLGRSIFVDQQACNMSYLQTSSQFLRRALRVTVRRQVF